MSTNSIFHEYDIRGKYPSEVNESIFYNIGVAFYEAFHPKKIAIGRDSRLSSDTLFLYFAGALKNRGVKVIDLGKISTPFSLWYSKKYKTDSAMITASHNPPDFNGIKINSYRIGSISKSSGLLKIKDKLDKLGFSNPDIDTKNLVFKKHQPIDEYAKFYSRLFKIPKPKLKAVLDFSHGTAGKEYVSVLEKFKINFSTLNEIPNGNFPVHDPNPLNEKSQKAIKVLMKSKKFDLGAIIDGDGDRILFFDELGELIESSYILCLLIEYFADKKKNKTIVRNIALGRIVDEVGDKYGFKTIVTKVGYAHVKDAMKKYSAQIGAEKSGHYFFKNMYNIDATLFAFLAIFGIIIKTKKPLSHLVAPYKKYLILPEINYPFEGKIDKIIGELKEKFKSGKINELDGIGFDFDDWKFNLRKSNNEELWRLTLEGYNKEKIDQARKEVEKILYSK